VDQIVSAVVSQAHFRAHMLNSRQLEAERTRQIVTERDPVRIKERINELDILYRNHAEKADAHYAAAEDAETQARQLRQALAALTAAAATTSNS
jgi:hypothetical protein